MWGAFIFSSVPYSLITSHWSITVSSLSKFLNPSYVYQPSSIKNQLGQEMSLVPNTVIRSGCSSPR